MKIVTSLQVLIDVSKFLKDMQTWCDQNGEYGTGMVSISLKNVEQMSRCIDAVLDQIQNGTPILVANGYDGVYEQLVGKRRDE